NYGEVYYIVARELGLGKAEEIAEVIKTLPINIVEVDLVLAKEAAKFKAKFSISYADCFAAALAKLKKAEVLTGDKEFGKLAHEIKIMWIS
ncbi:MAG: PIN domain-containing protein, partial [Acidobacteriota bacterium]|nr:PIN domain-containing protein [Acidobacteriota bacterium]